MHYFFTFMTDLTIESHTSEPVKYEWKDGQWYVQNGVDVKDTQQRKGIIGFKVYTVIMSPFLDNLLLELSEMKHLVVFNSPGI